MGYISDPFRIPLHALILKKYGVINKHETQPRETRKHAGNLA